MPRSSTLLTRLALALLAVLGFVAPLSTAEPARVVQTAGGKPSVVVPDRPGALQQAALVREKQVAPSSMPPCPLASRQPGEEAARRYLLHRAWLL